VYAPAGTEREEASGADDEDRLKRELRNLHLPGREPLPVDVPEMAFVVIDGHGDPDTVASYREVIDALYAVGLGGQVRRQSLALPDRFRRDAAEGPVLG
jgi:hypothetical protein